MQFLWKDEEQDFRIRVREFLSRELPSDWPEIARHGPGSKVQTEFSLEFCPRLAASGLLMPHWPIEWGGSGASAWQHLVLGEEMWAAGEPRGAQYMNVNWIGPTLMRFGSEEQKQRYIPQMAQGSAIWCQGFSEPGAGSDLASLRTSAVRDGDNYVINGSKIWTSYASMAEHCFLLARIADNRSGKAAIAIFLMPMSTPGIEVRSIPSLIGHGDIHEVFLTDVCIPASQRLGEEGAAWEIISYSLTNERVGLPRYHLSELVLGEMVHELMDRGLFDDPIMQMRAGEALAACEAARLLVYRVVDGKMRQSGTRTDASIARLAVIAADHAVSEFGMDYLPDSYSGHDQPQFLAHHERAIVSGIAAGAAEIQMNLVARYHLGLPKGA